jgi:serine/threonine-protein kinase
VIGQTVSHYRILEKLGSGGMGVVYRAEDYRLRRPVALKFLQPASHGDRASRERFLREAHSASCLDHPNLCTIYEVDTAADGQMFIAMAYYEGETLAERLHRGPLSPAEAVGIALQVLAGLEYAHERGIHHRDIKPSNLLITRRGEVKILDFGVARLAEDATITRTGIVVGTLPYMAPEQLRGDEVGTQADLWAVGVLLNEMLTGERPFKGNESAMRHSILTRNPDPMVTLGTEETSLLQPVVLRALAREPWQRYQTAGQMRDDLLRVQSRISPAAAAERPPAAAESPPSIAVLPFADLSPGRDQDYFCAGIGEELISALAHLQGVRVASRTSSFQYRDQAVDVRRIGAELNVRTVLEGSVRKAGNRLRITVQLTDVGAGYSLWSGRYDRELEDVFAIQEEIASSIVAALRERFDFTGSGQVARRRTEDLEAYHAYLKGRYFWNKRSEEDLRKGIRFFEEAIEKDPEFALAYAGLADSYLLLGIYGAAPPAEVMPKGREAALRALELDRTLAEAHASLACISAVYDWNWPRARESFQKAIQLAPGYATAHQWYGINLLTPFSQFAEAARALKTALELDPLSLAANVSVAIQRFYAREYDQAIEQCLRTLEIDPDFATARLFLGLSYLQKGEPEKALAELGAAAEREGSAEVLAGLGYALGQAGERQEAARVLDRLRGLSSERYISSALIAQVHAGLDDTKGALDSLGRAFGEHATELAWLRVRPFFDRLHGEPRFSRLLDGIGL